MEILILFNNPKIIYSYLNVMHALTPVCPPRILFSPYIDFAEI